MPHLLEHALTACLNPDHRGGIIAPVRRSFWISVAINLPIKFEVVSLTTNIIPPFLITYTQPLSFISIGTQSSRSHRISSSDNQIRPIRHGAISAYN